jgi:hypothetical protein
MEAWSTCRGLRAAHWSTSIRAPACLDNHRCRTTDAIPGARGCTPQSCSFRDYFAELRELGVGQLYGLSTQDIAYQSEAVERLNLPFAILSDRNLVLTRAIELPTFAHHRHRRHQQGFLPRISAGQERRAGDCYARGASGHATAAPPTRVMKSRRLIGRSVRPKDYYIAS